MERLQLSHEAGILGDLRREETGDKLCHQEQLSALWCYTISGMVCYQLSSLPPSSSDVVYFLFTSPSKCVVQKISEHHKELALDHKSVVPIKMGHGFSSEARQEG